MEDARRAVEEAKEETRSGIAIPQTLLDREPREMIFLNRLIFALEFI